MRALALFALTISPSLALADPSADARRLLAELVAIDTTNPPGNEELATQAVAKHLEAAGVKPELVSFAPGRGCLVARLKGDGTRRPLLLLAHLDVVGAAGQPWTLPPFQLTEKAGWLYGRGVTDDKGWAAIATTLFLELARAHPRLHRDVILALTGDEESGGAGIRWILDHKRALVGDAEWALNEGGNIKLGPDGKVISVGFQPAEKTYQSFELIAHGMGGHSSVPNDENAIYRIARALDRVAALKFPPRLSPTLRESLKAWATTQPEPRASALRVVAAAKEPPDDALAVLDAYPLSRAAVRTTCVATMLSGGTRENALPVEARATVNCRIMPVDKTDDIARALTAAINDPKVELKPIADFGAGPELPAEGPVRDAIVKVAQELFGAVPVSPSVGTGATDSRFLRRAGVKAYGISVTPKPEELTRSAHGPDEGMPAASIQIGYDFLRGLVRELAQ
jgi:acetylornithine deacetylase/succinyl-diaminopimelate desuccinylase-like protein